MRGAVWTAVLTISAVKTRHACYSTADMFINAIIQLKGRYRPARRKPQLDGSSVTISSSVDENVKDGNRTLPHSVEVAAGGAGLTAASSTVAERF